jgi:drug/metabolite transporter (DMT)-like permease
VLPGVLLLSAVVIWGWTFVATKILVVELGPVEIFALRLAIGLPFLGGVLLAKRVPLRFARRRPAPSSGRRDLHATLPGADRGARHHHGD